MQGGKGLAVKAVLGFWLLAGTAIATVVHLQGRSRRRGAVCASMLLHNRAQIGFKI